MAERRMFAKSIIDSDAFLDMPLSAQALYFHLSMRADDDGFVNNPKRIQRVIGCNDDDFNVLVAKRFVLMFESGIIVIKHWKIHNYIRNDRKKDTAYPEEMSLLEEKDNGAYTFRKDLLEIEEQKQELEISEMKESDIRKMAYADSSLPYSFDYKIRQAFYGKPCPICNRPMRGMVDECGVTTDAFRPTIQHNLPISKGGKHELGNISVVCHQCNVSIRDTETDRLNADEVIEVWDCLSSDRQMSVKCPSSDSVGKDSIGKVSIGKDSIVKDSIVKDSIDNNPPYIPPTEKKKTVNLDISQMLEESDLSDNIKESVKEWIAYKKEQFRFSYKPTGFKAFLTEIQNNENVLGTEKVCQAINLSMGKGYKGIIWDLVKDKQGNSSPYMDAIKNRVSIVDSWT